MGRTYIVPIGEQPGAVLTPLLASDLRPTPEDRVMVISGDRSWPEQRLAEVLGLAASQWDPIRIGTSTTAHRLGIEVQKRCRPGAAVLLANGGPIAWSAAIIAAFHAAGRPLDLALTRDDRGFIHRNADASVDVHVGALGLDRLLAVHGLQYDLKKGCLRSGQNRLPVCRLEERHGELFATIDPRTWDTPGANCIKDRRKALRSCLRGLTDAELRSFALMRRRCTINTSLLDRDLGEHLDRHVEAEGFASPDIREAGVPVPWGIHRGVRHLWHGPPLALAIGPQPSSVLDAIHAHRPRRVIGFVDRGSAEAQVVACHLVSLLGTPEAGLANLPSIELLPLPDRDRQFIANMGLALDRAVPEDDASVNISPGDKACGLGLVYWALARTHAIHVLSPKSQAETLDGEIQDGIRPPLLDLVTCHMPLPGQQFRPQARIAADEPLPPKLARFLDAVLQCMPTAASDQDLPWQRSADGGWRCAGVEIGTADLGVVSEVFSRQWTDRSRVQFGRAGGVTGGEGRWFEWVVARAVMAAGAAEVLLGAEILGGTSPEADIIARCGSTRTVWSVKTGQKKLHTKILDARGQADIFLGRRGLGLLVVRHLPKAMPQGLHEESSGVWLDDDNRTRVIDCRALIDREAMRRLLGYAPSSA